MFFVLKEKNFISKITHKQEMKISEKIILMSLLLFNLPFLLLSFTHVSAIESLDDYVFPPDSEPYGQTYGKWEAKFWELHVNLEPDKSPASPSYQPTECLLLQDDNMTFLSDFYSEIEYRNYECKISQIPFAIPALTEGCSYGDFENPNDKMIEDCIRSHNPYAIVTVTIDGKEIPDIDRFRITSDWFILNVTNKDNVYDIKPGSHKAKIDAIMPIIKPLPPGIHEVRTEVFQDVPSIIMSDVPLHRVITYKLNVESNLNN
jgi:hypothetical protein